MTVSEQEYLRLALADPDSKWELYCGELRSRPPMTWEHVRTAALLGHDLQRQLDPAEYIVLSEAGRIRRTARHYFVPDVIVVPVSVAHALFREPGSVAYFPDPMPFIAEVWLPSTGENDVQTKLPEYRRRGDQEIWFLHPYERTVTTWVRQADGGYVETVYRDGVVQLSSLPGVSIDLNVLFGS